jgi:hypothetical protein
MGVWGFLFGDVDDSAVGENTVDKNTVDDNAVDDNAVDDNATESDRGDSTDSADLLRALATVTPYVTQAYRANPSPMTIGGLTGYNPRVQRHVRRITQDRNIDMSTASPRELVLVFTYVLDSCAGYVGGSADVSTDQDDSGILTVDPKQVFLEDPLFRGISDIDGMFVTGNNGQKRFSRWIQDIARIVAHEYEHPGKAPNTAQLVDFKVNVRGDVAWYGMSRSPTVLPHEGSSNRFRADENKAITVVRDFVANLDQMRCMSVAYTGHAVALAFVPTQGGDVDVCLFDPMPFVNKRSPVAVFLNRVKQFINADPTHRGRRIRNIVHFSGWQSRDDDTARTCVINSLFWMCNVYLNVLYDTKFMSIDTIQKVTNELNNTMLRDSEQRAFMYQYMVSLMTYVFMR